MNEVINNVPHWNGWGWSEMLWVALISICLVFIVLVLLVYVMKLFGVIFTRNKSAVAPATSKPVAQGQLHEEEIAAIAVALKLYQSDLHDRESEVLTIMNIKRAYSPWNSKIHGLTPAPERK
jgi:Na+-transporting methylmalonyl-CoA/oxaloacetate decarboxylase gamma subunit